jgi:hypothetical protein
MKAGSGNCQRGAVRPRNQSIAAFPMKALPATAAPAVQALAMSTDCRLMRRMMRPEPL